MDTVKVNIYGDSIMRATVIDEDTLRYHATISDLLEEIDAEYGVKVNNRSRFGLTVDKGEAILDKDLQKGLECDYAIVEYGGNDCSFLWDEVAKAPEEKHLPFTNVEKFKEVITAMVNKLKAADVTPILMTLPPVDAERHLHFIGKNDQGRKNILYWLGDTNMIYRFHELYSRAAEQVALSTGAILVDVRSRFLTHQKIRELVGVDGVHLSKKGYRLVADAFAEFIQEHRLNPSKRMFA